MTSVFLFDLGIAVAAALILSALFHALRLPMVAGQLAAGMIIGPYGLGLIKDTTAIDFLATLGIILLLFVTGLEIDPRALGHFGVRVVLLTAVEFAVSFLLATLSGLAIGWSIGASLFLGSALGLSSTAIVLRLLADRSPERREQIATLVLMVMVMEDLIAVLLLFLTPGLAAGNYFQGEQVLIIGAKIGLLLAITIAFGRYAGPRLINIVSQYEMEMGEVAFLLALSFGFLFGVLSDYLGFSPGIGALLAGFFLPMKQSRYVKEKILPLKEAFIVFFFLSMGMLVNAQEAAIIGIPLVLIIVAAVGGKLVGGELGGRLVKIENPILVGALLIPRGEFSLVLAKAGVDSGLVPAEVFPVAGFAVLATTLISPLIGRRLAKEAPLSKEERPVVAARDAEPEV